MVDLYFRRCKSSDFQMIFDLELIQFEVYCLVVFEFDIILYCRIVISNKSTSAIYLSLKVLSCASLN